MPTSFTKKIIEVAVKLATNSQTNQPNQFSGTGSDTVTLSGHRTSVRVQYSGAPAGSSASVDIWGLTPSLMNELSTLGLAFNIVPANVLTITAGDEENGLSTIFSGTIMAAYGSYDEAPNVPMKFECNAGVAAAVAAAPASSFTGSTDVATVMAGFARQLGYGFQNNGVTIQLASPYFSGNLWTQMQACADHAGINAEVVGGNVLAIWPKGGTRTAVTLIPVISKETGMVGYPAFTQQGIIFKTLFNPKIAFGAPVQVKSDVLAGITAAQVRKNPKFKVPVDSLWSVYKLDHALDSQVPRGQWMSTVYGYNPNYPKPVPRQA